MAVACGTAAAIVSIPSDFASTGALFWPALCCTVGLLAGPILGLRTATAALLRTEYVLMVGLVYWLLLDPLQGSYPLDGVDYGDVVLTFTAIGTIAVGIWIGASGTGWSLPALVVRVVNRPLSCATLFRAVWIAFLLGMFYFAFSSNFDPIVMFNGLGEERFSAPWSRGAAGGIMSFVEHMKYFGYVLPSLTVLIASRDGWSRPRVVSAVIMSAVMLAFLSQDGGRRIIGVTIGAALMCWLLLQGQIRTKLIVGGSVGVTILLVGMEAMLQFRTVGYSSVFAESGPKLELSRLHVDDNFLRLSQIVQFFPEIQPYLGTQPLVFALMRPIPRAIWQDKPTDPGYDLAAIVGLKGVSLTQSIIGELYTMHGLLVVFIGGLFFGRLARMWNKILALRGGPSQPLVYGLGVMTMLAGLRSMQDFVIMSYGVLGWFVIASLIAQAGGQSISVRRA
jgi:hypothetical protein